MYLYSGAAHGIVYSFKAWSGDNLPQELQRVLAVVCMSFETEMKLHHNQNSTREENVQDVKKQSVDGTQVDGGCAV